MCGDIGQGAEELDGIEEKARKSGASEVYVDDMREEFVRDYVWPMVRSGAVYEDKYLLGTSIARPLLAKRQVDVALATGCDALSHGCTGKGNDQVRFELTYKAWAPHLPVIAPWRMWDINSREDAIDYATAHNIPIDATKAKIYSRDRNLWHPLARGWGTGRPYQRAQRRRVDVDRRSRGCARHARPRHGRLRERYAGLGQRRGAQCGDDRREAERDRRRARHRPLRTWSRTGSSA